MGLRINFTKVTNGVGYGECGCEVEIVVDPETIYGINFTILKTCDGHKSAIRNFPPPTDFSIGYK